MITKTFISEGENQDLFDHAKQTILFIKGEISSSRNNSIYWKFTYGKQSLKCKTIIKGSEIETTVTNTANVFIGEGVVVNKFFNLLSERVIVHEKKIKPKRIDSKRERNFSVNSNFFERNKFFKILGIGFCCLFIYFFVKDYDKNVSSNSATENISQSNNYVTNSGFKASYDENTLEKLVKYSVHNDLNSIQTMLLSGEVFNLPEGKEAYILESKFGRVKIHLIESGEEVWTFTEAIFK